MTITVQPLAALQPNPSNPRVIKDDQFQKLVQSLKDFPEMMSARPLIVNMDNVILGGNMRFKAAQEAGWTEIATIQVNWSDAQQEAFMFKDNVTHGDWDWDTIANQWDVEELVDWGVPIKDWGGYQPNITPEFGTSTATNAQIEARAKELADEIVRTRKLMSVTCPKCGEEFGIE